MNAKEILVNFLTLHGYAGFYHFGECACMLHDLAPCGEYIGDCEPGYLGPCDCGDHDWHIVPREETT